MNLKILIPVFITFLLIVNLVFATPGVPNAFYGFVTLNGQSAPDGTTVVAKINGVQVASTTTSGGKYGYSPIFYVDDPNNDRTGEIVNFFVNGVDTGQFSYFCNACVTMLNLTATVTTGGQQQGGGGAGGGGGAPEGGTTQTTTQGAAQPCQERWICSEWSTCVNGVQTRTCNDVNNCGTNNNEPLTAQPCSVEEKAKEVTPLTITGLVALISSSTIYQALIALGIIALLLTIFRLRRKRKGLALFSWLFGKSKK